MTLALLPCLALALALPVSTTNRHPWQLSVPLAWDQSPDPTVTGYNLYQGGESGVYTNRLDCGLTNFATFTWTTPPYGATLYWAVTAYNASALESLPSNEVSWTIPLPKTNIVLTVTGALELSTDLATWRPNFEDPFTRTNAPGPLFFRNDLTPPQISITHF